MPLAGEETEGSPAMVLDALAFLISHDLRVFLRHINGCVKLHQKKAQTVPDQRSRHDTDMMTDAVRKME